MSMRYLQCLLLVFVVGIFLTACDQSSQNVDYEVGENLSVSGPTSVVVPEGESATAEYIVSAFTINKEYNWSVDGVASLQGTRRDGEVAIVEVSEPGSFTVTVETTVDGEPTTGSVSAEASME